MNTVETKYRSVILRRRLSLALTRLGRNRMFPRRLPSDLGGAWFPASLEGGARYLKRDLHTVDPPLLRFATHYVSPECQVWDIGANVGLFSFVAAGLGAHVLSVEADTWLAANLQRAAARQSLSLRVLPVAIDRCYGIKEFIIASASRSTNYLAETGGSTMTGGVRERVFVPTVHLDSLLENFEAPQVLKIDVEGAEVAVLEGGLDTLSHRPVLFLEVSAENQHAVDMILRRFGYRYIDADTGLGADRPAYNTIATAQSGLHMDHLG